MVDLLSESRVSMTELAHQEGVAVPTVWRWRQKGVRGVRLESYMIGGKRCTTQEAFSRFVERTTAAADGEASSSMTSRQRQIAHQRDEAALDAMGI